jgi:nucleotide-binding universal stress UspA family protein
MYRTILIGYDGSEHADDALALGRLLGDTTGAKLIVAGVFPEDPLYGGQDPAFRQRDDELATAVQHAAESVGGEAEAMPSSSTARGLHELAVERETDLIVVGSSHRAGIGRVLAGSVAKGLLHGAPCAVSVAPAGYRDQDRALSVIGVGYDGLPEAEEALAAAIALGQEAEGTLRILMAADPPWSGPARGKGWYPAGEYADALEEEYRARLDKALESTPSELRAEVRMLKGQPAAALLHEAGKGIDLLCIGSRGYGPLRRVLLGSVSGELVESAPCPVLVTPRGAEEQQKNEGSPAAAEGAR